jgi:hypothetical protein
MADRSPFDFDMRVSSDKKRKTRGRRGMSGAVETSTRVCEHEGCDKPGKYRAPKSPDRMDEYYWFCMEHVRAYNLNWNAFAAGAEQDLAAQMASDKVWNRDTKPFRRSVEEQAWARLGISDAHEVLGQNATRNPGRATTGTRKLPPTERKAIEILDVRDTATKTEVRKAYKALIKVLHPDMNGGDRSDEERLQEVVWAWDQIKDSRNFRD